MIILVFVHALSYLFSNDVSGGFGKNLLNSNIFKWIVYN